MPTPQKSTKKTPTRAKTTTAAKKNTKSSASKSTAVKSAAESKKQQKSIIYTLRQTPAGMVLIYIISMILLIALNLLLSLNSFDTFFLMLGIELVVFLCIRWLLFALKNKKKKGIDN